MRIVTVMTISLALVGSLGCQNAKTRTAEGAAVGGVLGAIAGGIIGHNDDRHGGEGAAIGAAVGAVTGAVVGSRIEKPAGTAASPQESIRQSPAAVQQAGNNPNQLPLTQVVTLTKQGVHEDVIIDRLRLSGSRYALSETDIAYLKDNGVSSKVIAAMQSG